MYIERLIIEGFKSYKKKVVIDLSRGSNVIVGKNGAGKSNIFSAIEFVLSDKYHPLRQETRKQLVFDAGQSNVISASVEIIFCNEDGRIPIKNDKVSIKRVIGAKKDEYILDGKHASKQEIDNLLESAGLSKLNQYFIVAQGKVAQRCKEKDSERLQLLTDIAGTRIYDERRTESSAILTSADNKRNKVNTVINYMEARINSLEEEMNELQQFNKLNRKYKVIEYCLLDKQMRDTKQELTNLEQELNSLQQNGNGNGNNNNKNNNNNNDYYKKLNSIDEEIKENEMKCNELKEINNTVSVNLDAKRINVQNLQKTFKDVHSKLKNFEKERDNIAKRKQQVEDDKKVKQNKNKK